MHYNEPDIGVQVKKLFGIEYRDLTFYRILPRGYPFPEAPIIFDKTTIVSRAELEALLGLRLPSLPDNRELRIKVPELGDSSPEAKYVKRYIFQAVLVTDLPPPHNPYRCGNRVRFENLRRAKRPSDHRGEQEVGRQFITSLTMDEVSACYYHRADWATIANESARVVESVGRLKPKYDYLAEARRGFLSGQEERTGSDLKWLVSLFESPVIIAGGSYTDGQHRGCALRFSGAPRAAVVTGSERVALPPPNDWQYEGDG